MFLLVFNDKTKGSTETYLLKQQTFLMWSQISSPLLTPDHRGAFIYLVVSPHMLHSSYNPSNHNIQFSLMLSGVRDATFNSYRRKQPNAAVWPQYPKLQNSILGYKSNTIM